MDASARPTTPPRPGRSKNHHHRPGRQRPSTFVHIPALDAVVVGDVGYDGVHQFLAFTDHDKRLQWIASVEQVEQLNPRIVIAGRS
jgi:hypothetical protein